MEVKKIVEGMTAPQVAQVIDDNFKAQNAILEEDIAKQNNVIGVSEYKDFSEAEAVNVGDVRKYEGFLYECVEATTGAFDASKWKKSSFKRETEKRLTGLEGDIQSKMDLNAVEEEDREDSIEIRNTIGEKILSITEEGVVGVKSLEVNGKDVSTQFDNLSKKIDLSSTEQEDNDDSIEIRNSYGKKIFSLSEEGVADVKSLKVDGKDIEDIASSIDLSSKIDLNAVEEEDSDDCVEVRNSTGETVLSISNDGTVNVKSLKVDGRGIGESVYLSDKLNKNVFVRENQSLNNDSGWTNREGYCATYFVNIERVTKIEFTGLNNGNVGNNHYPVYLFDSEYNFMTHADVVYDINDTTSGEIDMKPYNAKFAIFNSAKDKEPIVKMYVGSVEDKNYRCDVKVGAYYFAGFFERTFPNIHNTQAFVNEYKGRKPFVGWLGCGCFKGEGWAITPLIQLNSGNSYAIIQNSCLFYKGDQCKIYVRESKEGEWTDVTPALPSSTNTEISETTVDLSAFEGKNIQIGFKLTTHASEESAIWTINGIKVMSNGVAVYDKDYTDHNNFDLEITDSDVWKASVKTMAYDGLNGYVGDTYDYNDYSKVDKEILLAKEKGIDYFMLEWFYHDNKSSINEDAIWKEENHIGINVMMRSCQKLGFHYALMITNHEPFVIEGLDNWKEAFRYLNRMYFSDPSYMFVDGKPVVTVFSKPSFEEYLDAINELCIEEFGYNGLFYLNVGYNNVNVSGEYKERNVSELYKHGKHVNYITYTGARHNKGYYIPYITCGWDTRPWADRPNGYARPSDWFIPNADEWKDTFEWCYDFAKVSTEGVFKSILICAWNEYGEGSYLAPTEDDKRAKLLCAIDDVKKKNMFNF